jgi:hypothetical protein
VHVNIRTQEFVSFVQISEQTATISLYCSKLSVYITGEESVYSAVRFGSSNQTYTVSSLTGLNGTKDS